MNSTIRNPVLLTSPPIPGGMFPGRMVRVKGSTPLEATKFGLNFQHHYKNAYDMIAFHFNPRFTSNTAVRNHYIAGAWGVEEEDGALPLTPGTPFDILFICHYDRFKVMINGAHFCDFFHRVPFHRISNINAWGDVSIESIEFGGTPPPVDYLSGQANDDQVCGPY
ncbi:galectin-7-like [Spodoptera frugiperda]|uniref:Galectin n=1 Tax=Spodoptera frugiperda TaxID=7108 RepID=A0A9R0E6U3_SPOFR|nr:galectin-7-like [Spodoptera frugiperda]